MMMVVIGFPCKVSALLISFFAPFVKIKIKIKQWKTKLFKDVNRYADIPVGWFVGL